MRQVLLGVVGFSSGFIVAGGIVALMVGLGIIVRFIGITRTAGHIMMYENAILLGAVGGTLVTVYSVSLSVGSWFLLIGGLFTGIFVGGWIMALAEVINVFPVYTRRLGLVKGMSWIVIALAAGKALGSLYYFWRQLY